MGIPAKGERRETTPLGDIQKLGRGEKGTVCYGIYRSLRVSANLRNPGEPTRRGVEPRNIQGVISIDLWHEFLLV